MITADDPHLHNGGSVCPREVTFTCVTTGSPIIRWSSDQYIGTGNAQLMFSANKHIIGDAQVSRIDNRTVAIFIRNNKTNGRRVLESKLRLHVLPNSGSASISCGQTSFQFNVIGKSFYHDLICIYVICGV